MYAGCTKTHAVIKNPLASVALIGTYCEIPVLLVPVTTTLEPVALFRDTRLEAVDQVIVLGALAG
jgi:hypothetical protein